MSTLEKQGYKYTEEFGYIPDDWKVKTVKEFATIQTGSKNTEDKIDNGLYPFFVRSQTIEYINEYAYDEEAVLTAGDGVGVGKVFHYINGKFNVHQRVYKISDFKDVIGKYFYLFFKNNFYNAVKKYTAKSSVDSVRLEMIADMKILVPSITEQKKIAEVLGDIDSLIDKTQQLINKKKDLKTATMQKLLSPKEDWVTKTLEEVFDFIAGGDVDKETFSKVWTSKFCYPIYSNSIENNGLYGYSSKYVINKDAVTITGRGDVGHVFYHKPKFTPIIRLVTGVAKYNINVKFFSYLMKRITFRNESTGVPQLTVPQIQKYYITYPLDLTEQNRIATILSDMDSEIEALEKELNKYKDLKTGMMQQLLTGKVRLV